MRPETYCVTACRRRNTLRFVDRIWDLTQSHVSNRFTTRRSTYMLSARGLRNLARARRHRFNLDVDAFRGRLHRVLLLGIRSFFALLLHVLRSSRLAPHLSPVGVLSVVELDRPRAFEGGQRREIAYALRDPCQLNTGARRKEG
jgi:hypothetical protein